MSRKYTLVGQERIIHAYSMAELNELFQNYESNLFTINGIKISQKNFITTKYPKISVRCTRSATKETRLASARRTS